MSTTTLTTLIGLGKAMLAAVITAIMTATDEGTLNFKSPIFWMGIIFAAFEAAKGYYTQGIPGATVSVPKAVPVILLCLAAIGLTACSTSTRLPNGLYGWQFKMERPSMFGTNTALTRGAQCPQDLSTFSSPESEGYAEAVQACQWVQSEWHDASSQGQGGQVLSGALQAAGLGIAGALIGGGGNATANAAASATQSQSVVPRGH